MLSQESWRCFSSIAELTLVGWLGSYGGEDSTSDISRGALK
jgi:hypothetical protein